MHDKPILLTGASGALGRMLAAELSAAGFTLRLTDIAPFPDPLPPRATFTRADLNEALAIVRQAEGCPAIVHFGGCATEQPYEAILEPNIRGLYHVYEAARREGARVVFASSNHTIGFHERPGEDGAKLDFDCAFRPDGYYGLSKVYGELMGRLYWDKHGVENVNIRIGSCLPEPNNARGLSTWLSYPDLARCVERSILAPRTGHCVIWGASANPASFWGKDHRDRIGWQPQDSAEAFRDRIAGVVSGNPVEERYQGGFYCPIEYSRKGGFSPRDPFALD
ncbi:NAD-dependent epimerase/dehydratase family protein [Falsiroseomonas sp. CW058]|uniref:NAD-dependent epimerase/dehydratase family protein n=1 Tax=Falsiroseomonas sp. CW058 TaxID=3388664 RepID=UPI003D3122D7